MSMSNSTRNKFLAQKRRLLKWKNAIQGNCWIYIVYAMTTIGFDIVTAITTISQFMQKLGYEQWKVVKRIMRYLQGACDY
jgi:predicted ferric reductase